MKIPIAHLQERAKERPPGYMEDVIASGRLVGDVVELNDEAYRRLIRKYSKRKTLLSAILRWMKKPTVPSVALYLKRLPVCRLCDSWIDKAFGGLGKCRRCGCTRLKLFLHTERCPVGKW